jgi:peptidoglycan/LPS O-acetylase OafA/YrhL
VTGKIDDQPRAVMGVRNRTLDLLRIGLAVMVLVEHAYDLTGNFEREPLRRLGFYYGSGGVAVSGFFLLSGWLIVASWNRDPRLGDFLAKRALRILPGWAVAVALTVFVEGWLAPSVPHFFHALMQAPWHKPFLLSVARMDSLSLPVFPGQISQAANGSLWTLGYEVRAYLAVGLLGVMGAVKKRYWLPATLFFALVDIEIKHVLGHGVVWKLWDWGILEPSRSAFLFTAFFTGGCFYLLRDRISFRPAYAIVAVLTLVSSARWSVPAVIEDVAGGYLLLYLGERVVLPNRGWIRNVPDISFGMYIYGYPVQQLLIWYLHPRPLILLPLSIFISAALGMLSWYVVERPMLRLKPGPRVPEPAARGFHVPQAGLVARVGEAG